jgi:hypothetical protein
MISHTCLHCGSDPQSLMHPPKVYHIQCRATEQENEGQERKNWDILSFMTHKSARTHFAARGGLALSSLSPQIVLPQFSGSRSLHDEDMDQADLKK